MHPRDIDANVRTMQARVTDYYMAPQVALHDILTRLLEVVGVLEELDKRLRELEPFPPVPPEGP